MSVPKLVDEIHFDDGISAIASNRDDSMLAVGTMGILGLYRVCDVDGVSTFSHEASFVIPGDRQHAVVEIVFSDDGRKLFIKAEDGIRRELSLEHRSRGMLIELSRCQADSADREDAAADSSGYAADYAVRTD